ncbi:MAG: hypothetical protein Q9212_001433 [Teloschistes hypoglaucus]
MPANQKGLLSDGISAWFIVPVPKATVQSLVFPYQLITPPVSDPSLFPTGFPAGMHPVVVSTGYQNDIRMLNLDIKALFSGGVAVPYVDYLGDQKTPFNFLVQGYIGGINGNDLEAVVPTTVGNLEGTTLLVATFSPNNDAYALLASNPAEFGAQVKQIILNNPLNPSLRPPAFDLDFFNTQSPLYTTRTFRVLINQPQISNNRLMCLRNTYYFNDTFAEPTLREGTVTLYGFPKGSLPSALGGRFEKLGGFSASSNLVGHNPELCAVAASKVDPVAVQ